ncbi:hypothetical protein [Lysinibacter sp. HNR]|uniref:hypothetical protein n=1 Tax=Lysinibacter sp. HNR TaxID=3031408 RepID=UPI002434C884|nr:hypothetical protein [Lysinibacter sp. HNR]WGD37574.1 hypothetical protein FrondiHNR_01220 [Lysinibacter sp. HNR]
MGFFDDLIDKFIFRNETNNTSTTRDYVPGLSSSGIAGRNHGAHLYVEAPPEFEASSAQICGFFPFILSASSHLIGAPLGTNLLNHSTVCGDPISYFINGITSSPSGFMLGLNGRGKSSLGVRVATYLVDVGHLVLVLGDLKPDYVGFTLENGGKVINLGRSIGGINPLDCGPWKNWLHKLSPETRKTVEAGIHGRRLNVLQGLIEFLLQRSLTEKNSETTILSIAIKIASENAAHENRQPLPSDVQGVVASRHPQIRAQILEITDKEYDAQVRDLLTGLNGLGKHGPFGDVFCRHTTEEMPLDASVCFNVAGVDENDTLLRAAIQLVCWSYGQAGASCAKILADEKDMFGIPLAPEVHHMMIMDELWQILRAWEGSVYRIDGITRINRTEGLGQLQITHSMKDLELSTPELTKIAIGFVERSAVLYLGGLARNEMPLLEKVRRFSNQEKEWLVSWSSEGTVNPSTNEVTPPPGRGKFMLKTGEFPGIPFSVKLTEPEKRIHDTNEAWAGAIEAVRAT